ncbi:MAG TPA: helix-turn-helix domain-containing protein [Phycicoccus sp.]|jgi:AcrR family transcriptional regulator|nr:helix-turn-helix domain-containing protein [Phycicoccus sp.]HQH06219.1 helix-turn-helix domain-containing protein [Phycicoccus sp.]HQK30275.1 helix-turn-helix domain-containing protein [Phycicoccus sp.]HQY95636.1 helix-turn-helix domain-containing protein [Phycicoccus sp.]HRA43729.1 helix-turn-helix domain-containing protein [Phycicoccus sp.]
MTAVTTAPPAPSPGPAPAEEGLRARKKRETSYALHRAAIELIDELGDEEHCEGVHTVTVEAIAARAGVSPRTFFNYYPTKEAAITFTEPELGDRLAGWMLDRPAGESTAQAVRAVMLRRITTVATDEDFWRMRRRVTRRHPSLAAAMMGANALSDRAVAQAACDRLGVAVVDDITPAAHAYAALGAIRSALWQHMECGLKGSLEARVDDALIVSGLIEPRDDAG